MYQPDDLIASHICGCWLLQSKISFSVTFLCANVSFFPSKYTFLGLNPIDYFGLLLDPCNTRLFFV